MTEPRKHPELLKLEEQYKLGQTALSNTDGLRWKSRMEASNQYFRDYSWDWKENQALLSDVRALTKMYGSYVAITYAVAQSFISDTYYRNPDPLVQDRAGNKDLTKMLSDLFRSVHREVDSERKMKDALLDQTWAGFGCCWASFRQDGYVDPNLFDYSTMQQGVLVPTKQQVLLKRMSPWRIRFDPEGRDWDMSDHGWVALLYWRTLAQTMRDPKLTDEDKRRVIAQRGQGSFDQTFMSQSVRYSEYSAWKEEDPEYIRIPFWHIWARPEKLVYDQPVGASFTTTPQPWPEEFAEADMFPLRYMAKNREPEDEAGLTGFIGIPDIRLIKPHIYAINKLEALFLAANQHVINKYVTFKGVLDQQAQAKLADGVKQFAVLEVDQDGMNAFPTAMRDRITMKDVLTLVPQSELKDLQHLNGISHEFDMIAQIMGQGPADRGGESDSKTATGQLVIHKGLELRRSVARHEAGKHFNAITKLFHIILKARQTLPLRYQMTTAFNQQVWQEFSADTLRDLDLHFEYAPGSTEYRTREQEFELRQQMAQVLMPVLQAQQNTRLMMKLAQDLIEPLNIIGTEQYFNDEATQLVMQLLAILRGLGKGDIKADDPRAAKQIPELIAKLAQAILTPQQIAEVEHASAGAPPPQPEGEGSLPNAPTPGQQDFAAGASGSAMAGMSGGMAN